MHNKVLYTTVLVCVVIAVCDLAAGADSTPSDALTAAPRKTGMSPIVEKGLLAGCA